LRIGRPMRSPGMLCVMIVTHPAGSGSRLQGEAGQIAHTKPLPHTLRR